MKTLSSVLIVVSLALNLALLAVLFAGRQAGAPVASQAPAPAPTAASTGPAVDDKTWTRLVGDDLPAMVTQLRESGFPPEIVRAIMASRVRELYAARHRAIEPDADARPYWKAYSIDPTVQLAHSRLYREEQKALRELLGKGNDPQESLNALYQGRRLDSVPPEKIDDVQRLVREFDEKRSEVFSGGGMLGPEQQRRLTALEKEHHDALAAVLTPHELEEYDLRNSDSARSVRYNLSAFNPTEDEFRTIARLQLAFDTEYGRLYAMPSPEEQRRRETGQRQLNDQIKAALGAARGADYERATDYSYRQTSQLVARLELPPETTGQIWNWKKEYEDRSRALGRDSTLAADDRTRQLEALRLETSAKITTALGGPRGFDAFKQYGGYWLQPPRPPTPAPPSR